MDGRIINKLNNNSYVLQLTNLFIDSTFLLICTMSLSLLHCLNLEINRP